MKEINIGKEKKRYYRENGKLKKGGNEGEKRKEARTREGEKQIRRKGRKGVNINDRKQ